jgi:hypothetical protein
MTETTSSLGAPRSLLAFLRDGRAGETTRAARQGSRGRTTAWTGKRILALALMVLIPLIGVLGVLGAPSARAAEDEDAMKYSFYKIAASTTSYFSTAQEPGSEGFSTDWIDVATKPGSAGSLLGYADPDFAPVSGWLMSKLSGSSDAIGYETLLVRDGANSAAGGGNAQYQGMVDYAYFGAALKGMGLDSTSTGLSVGFMSAIAGGIVMLLFVMGGAVDFVFNGFVKLLELLNPFKLFYAGMQAINPELADGMVGNGSADVGPLSGLVSWIGGWYRILNSVSWTVMVPIFIATLIFTLLLLKKVDKGGAVKKIVIRVAFIGLGLPLLGTMYSGMISGMSDASSSGNSASTRVVMSTYVDFESWAMKSRLAIPSGANIAWNPKEAQPTGASQAQVRNTALAINKQTHGLNMSPIVSTGAFDASWSQQVMDNRGAEAATGSDAFATTVNMLVRYMSGAHLTAASYETISKGDLTQSAIYAAQTDTVQSWFDKLSDSKNLPDEDNDPQSNPLVSVTSGAGLQAADAGNGVRKFSSATDSCSGSGARISTDAGQTRSCNLSPLAMYNYLNTDFGETSMQMYSSQNVASEATRAFHSSVNQVGTGTMSFLYWFNAVVLLGSFVVIGLGYAFTLVFSSLRRSFQIVTAVPFATLGAIAAIAKVVVYSVALILEVLVTIFVYKMVVEILTSLPQIIEMPFATALSGQATNGFVMFLTSGWGFPLVVTLLSIIGVVLFTILAMRIRKVLVKAVEEAVTKIVEKFMDTQAATPSGGGLAPALAGGVAAGAGAAAANRMMSGGNKGAIGNALPAGFKGDGPDGVESGGGTVATGPGPDDGQLELTGKVAGADGNGDPGNGSGALPAGHEAKAASDEVTLGRDVEANGLSKPGETRAPEVGNDALDAASSATDKSIEGYKAADTKRLEAGTEGAKAAGQAGIAVGRGAAGDAKGATESAGKAVEHGGAAVAKNERAKQAESDAGRSSLDKPDQRHAQRAARADQVSKAGGSVSSAAGTMGGAKSVKGGAAPKASTPSRVGPAPQTAAKAPKPSTSTKGATPSAPRPVGPVQQSSSTSRTAIAPKAPKASAPRAPQGTRPSAPSAPRASAPSRPVVAPQRPSAPREGGDKK